MKLEFHLLFPQEGIGYVNEGKRMHTTLTQHLLRRVYIFTRLYTNPHRMKLADLSCPYTEILSSYTQNLNNLNHRLQTANGTPLRHCTIKTSDLHNASSSFTLQL